MPPPSQPLRYLGEVTRPDGTVSLELFLSLKDVRIELSSRFRRGEGSAYFFDYLTVGETIDLESIRYLDVIDTVPAGTHVALRRVHRDGKVEPLPHYLVTVNERGGTSAIRLKRGKIPS